MKKKICFIAVMLFVSAFAAGHAFADSGACVAKPHDGKHEDMDKVMARKLNLTAEQDKLLKTAREAHRAEMKAIEEALENKREELESAIAKPGAVRAQVEPIIAQINTLKAQAFNKRIDDIFKVKNILSPEQFKKLHDMRPERPKDGHMKHEKKEW